MLFPPIGSPTNPCYATVPMNSPPFNSHFLDAQIMGKQYIDMTSPVEGQLIYILPNEMSWIKSPLRTLTRATSIRFIAPAMAF